MNNIEWDRQFLFSREGFIPIWLISQSPKRDISHDPRTWRTWRIFQGWIGVSQNEMLNLAKPMLEKGNIHWEKKGHPIHDDEFLEWIATGCDTAMCLEQFLEVNHYKSIYFGISSSTKGDDIEKYCGHISSTSQLDDWIRRAKYAITESPTLKRGAIVFLSKTNLLCHPAKKKISLKEKYNLKIFGGFVQKISVSEIICCNSAEDAAIFVGTDILDLQEEYPGLGLKYATPISVRKSKKKGE